MLNTNIILGWPLMPVPINPVPRPPAQTLSHNCAFLHGYEIKSGWAALVRVSINTRNKKKL